MPKVNAEEIYKKLKKKVYYHEAEHCTLVIEIMSDPDKGTVSAFCSAANIGVNAFYRWLYQNELFKECYEYGKAVARVNWENEGREISEEPVIPGATNTRFDYWKVVGATRFSVGKAAKVRLGLDPTATPNQHYAQLIGQAADGEFTAAEVKQLMEAINVGLNTHQVFELQKEIDKLKADLAVMSENSNGNNTFANKGIKKED